VKESEIVFGVALAASGEPPRVTKPCEEPLDFPAPEVSTQRPAVLQGSALTVVFVRDDELDFSSHREIQTHSIAVVSLIGNQALGLGLLREVVEDFVDKGNFVRGGAVDGKGDWKTMTVDHCHPLRTFAAFGFTHKTPPFFAEAKLPSIKHSSQSSLPRASKSSSNARRTFRSVPSRHHF
jgi:hypothetical protein